MDPITALVTIVQLIGLFRQEKSLEKDLTHQQFMEWLEYHRHEQLKEFIAQTAHVSQEVDRLLREDQAVILAKLNDINAMVADILRHVEGLRSLATAVAPQAGLSEYAIAMVRYFVQSGAKTMVVHPHHVSVFFEGPGTRMVFKDSRFMDDDLASLLKHGFIISKLAAHSRVFNLTRRGATFVNMLPKQDEAPGVMSADG